MLVLRKPLLSHPWCWRILALPPPRLHSKRCQTEREYPEERGRTASGIWKQVSGRQGENLLGCHVCGYWAHVWTDSAHSFHIPLNSLHSPLNMSAIGLWKKAVHNRRWSNSLRDFHQTAQACHWSQSHWANDRHPKCIWSHRLWSRWKTGGSRREETRWPEGDVACFSLFQGPYKLKPHIWNPTKTHSQRKVCCCAHVLWYGAVSTVGV